MTDPLHYQTIEQLAPLIETSSLSPTELCLHMLERIESLDPQLRAYATVMSDHALAQARVTEQELANGQYRGPLHGIPVAVKDLCDTAGVRTMGGCRVLADRVPIADATVVSKLAAAGAVLLGKLNLTEGAMAGYNPEFQVPENPWKPGHWTGVSSSGSGSATAAGLAFATLGSDTGGSIRHPAAACGTVGLKPTWGRVSRHGVLDLAQSLDHVGPLTRSSHDAAVMLSALAGPDPNDPTALQVSPHYSSRTLGASGSKPLDGVRVGWDEVYASQDLASDLASAVAAAVAVLEQLGATIVPVTVPARLREYMAAWPVICASEAADAHRTTFPSRASEYGPWFAEWLRRGNAYTAADYAQAHHQRLACNGAFARTMADVDLLACPSSPRAAFPFPADVAYGPIPESRDPWDSRFTAPADYAGLPTLSVPCGLSPDELPLSLQLVGHPLSEYFLTAIGTAFEQATTWNRLHPPQP